jgi:glycosyltransferase involved in cell wall biosynthesis
MKPNSSFRLQLNKPITLSIASSAFNEEDFIEEIVKSWVKFLLAQRILIKKFEIIICNDGSTDGTANVLKRLGRKYRQVRPIHLTHNQGAAAALSIAISKTKYDWVLLLDSDGQFPIENFSLLWKVLVKSKAYSVIGIRQKNDSFFARFGTYSSGILCNMFHNSRIKDFNSALKLSWGPLLRSFNFEAKGMNYSTEITSSLLRAKVKLAQANSIHIRRVGGKSKIKLFRDVAHRLLFVLFLGLKIFLTSIKVLKALQYEK